MQSFDSNNKDLNELANLSSPLFVTLVHQLKSKFKFDKDWEIIFKESDRFPIQSSYISEQSLNTILKQSNWPQNLFFTAKETIFLRSNNDVISTIIKNFENDYFKKTKRKLIWTLNHGSAEITTQSENKKYFLKTTILQMAILLLMNDTPSLSLTEISSKLGVEKSYEKLFVESVRSLVWFALLTWTREDTKLDVN